MKIYVTPLSGLANTLEITGASHLISLLSGDAAFERPSRFDPARHLQLSMHDITTEKPGLTAPSPAHVKDILGFARAWDRKAPLVVHCFAGISRSTAAAYVIAAALQPQRDEAEIAQELRRAAPAATPNIRIVAIADDLLGRQERMIRAIQDIGRGMDAYEGAPFALPIDVRPLT